MSIYERALRLIEKDGWMQGPPGDHGGPLCVGVALHESVGHSEHRECEAAYEAIEKEVGRKVWEWNDDPHTTLLDVKLLLKRGAAGELG